jgi:hypothetical protein
MDQCELVRLVIRALEATGIPYMITGSQASAYYGEPRFTRDIDIVADINLGQVDDFIAYFSSNEFYCDKEMIEAEIKGRGQFNILHIGSGLKIDIILTKTTPFSKTEFSRRKKSRVLAEQDAYFASPEDVILKKMEYYREGGSEKHLRDITGILGVSGEEIDFAYIDEWVRRLDLIEIWEAIQKRLGERS